MNVVILSRRFLTKRDSNICMYFIHELNITITRIIETVCTIFTFLYESKISPVGTGAIFENFSCWHWRHFPTPKISPVGTGAIFQLPRPPPICGGGGERGCVTFKSPGWNCRLFYYF